MSSAAAEGAPEGWEAQLNLVLRDDGRRTVLASRSHRGPLVVQRPFYPEDRVCHLYLVHPPGGIVSGDSLTLDLRVERGAHGVVTTPAATKFYRARGQTSARLVQNLAVHDATLEWLPQETLVFDAAHARAATRVDLRGEARFIGWEVLCLGRPASDAPFERGSVHQDFELHRDGKPVLLDHLRLAPGPALHAPWGLGSQPALGTLIASPATAAERDAVRALGDDSLSATLVDGALLVRTLGTQGEQVRRCLQRVWEVLRPPIVGRVALAPRIWST